METRELMKKATIFHGHLCPGIAIGVLVAKYVLEHGFERSSDEELVAVVETDNCSVDALQALLGTTYVTRNRFFYLRQYWRIKFNFSYIKEIFRF